MSDPSATPTTVTAARPPYSQVPHALTRDTSLTLSARVVYDDLMARANESDECFPGIRTIASDIGVSTATVQRAISDLEASGWITVTRQGRKDAGPEKGQMRVNVYRVHLKPVAITDTGAYQPLTPARINDEHITRTRELEPENKNHLATRNVAWDFYTHPDGFNLPAKTKAQQQRVGRLARELNAKIEHEDGMTDTLFERAAAWPAHFPDATLTPEAFEKHFTQLGQPPLRRTKRDVDQATERAKAQAMMNTPRPISDARRKAQARR